MCHIGRIAPLDMLFTMGYTMTESEFIEECISFYGEAYVDDLFHRGFVPIKTSNGWKWLIDTKSLYPVNGGR